jgi:hypothetical protein
MARTDKPLKVEIPAPTADRPPWSRVGIIGLAGFVIGIAWPRLADVKIGPSVPTDAHAAHAEASAEPSAAPVASGAPAAGSGAPAASGAPSAAPGVEDAAAANKELVVVGPGKIVKCWDKKDKKVDDCGKLQFDPIALPKLRDLAKCPSAVGLDGKLAVGFEVDFQKKEVHVTKGKTTRLPGSTVNGVIQCAARDFANVALEDVPHKFRRYTLAYTATFYPPGKHPAQVEGDKPAEGAEGDAAGATTSESPAGASSATVTWDTALLRKDPKDGEVVARVVRGTKVKVLGRQNDWYRVESNGKTGWVYRGSIGL